MEKDLGPNQAVSHSRFPKPWGLPVRAANLCGAHASHAAGGSALLQAACANACLGKQSFQRAELSSLGRNGGEDLKQPDYPSISMFEQ